MNSLQDATSFIVVTPVFNDWESLQLMLLNLDEQIVDKDLQIRILVVDDGSTIGPSGFQLEEIRHIASVELLRLCRNMGHQRAIAIALAYIEAHKSCRAVIVMDADGEDMPSDVFRLIKKHYEQEKDCVIFAQRTKRSESVLFKVCYHIYQRFFKVLTGQEIRVGNFSLIPYELLKRIVVVSEIWNHYSSGILKARLPHIYLSCQRGFRLAGQSRMNYVSLVVHGLSAISVYGDVIGARALIASLGLATLSLVGIIVVILIKSMTTLSIPGWATYSVGIALIILLQSITISAGFAFLILSGRNTFSFLPQRDHHYFILEVQQLCPTQ